MENDSVLLVYSNTKGPSQIKQYTTTQELIVISSVHTTHT